MKTFDQYLDHIRQSYEIAKTGTYASYLVHPTPAMMKQLCHLLYHQPRLSKADHSILKHFFGWTVEEDAVKKMQHFDTEKLKPVCRFLSNHTQTPHQKLVDLLALLTDTQPRPYAKYLQLNIPDTGITLPKKDEELDAIGDLEIVPSKKPWKSYTVGGLLLAGAITTGILTTSPPCEKMVWQGASFIKIDCAEEMKYKGQAIEYYDAHRYETFKKVTTCDTTTFFKNDQPKLWYYKTQEGTIECFSAPGLHPEHGATLKKITPYMIKKYGLKGDCGGR
jgi:hypothetical protein